MTGDNRQKLLDLAIAFSGNNGSVLLSDIRNGISDTPDLLLHVYKLYEKTTDTSDRFEIAALLKSLLDIYNLRIKSNGLTYKPFFVDESGTFELHPDIISVGRYDLTNNKFESVETDVLKKEYNLKLTPGLYLYIEYNLDRIVTNFYFAFMPDFEIYNKFKENKIERAREYQLATEKQVSYPASYLSFNEAEIECLNIISVKQPTSPIIAPPELSLEYGWVTGTISENDFSVIAAIKKPLYLSIKETDRVLDDNYVCRVELPKDNPTFTFAASNACIYDDVYYYWIEDAAGVILSHVRVLDATVNVDKPLANDFLEKIRKLEIYNYNLHLKPYCINRYSEQQELIQEYLQASESNPEIQPCWVVQDILRQASTLKKSNYWWDTAKALFEDKTVYGDYYLEFFNEPIQVKEKENTVVMPVGNDIIYVFEGYSLTSTDPVFTYAQSNPLAATSFRFYDCDFGVARAINLKDYKMSGFLLLDFRNKKTYKVPKYAFLVDAITIEEE